MGQISIKIQNRTYRLTCGDGEEPRLLQLAEYVRVKAQQLVDEHGRISDEHLMLMSAILIADELWDERGGDALVNELTPDGAEPGNSTREPSRSAKSVKEATPVA